MSDDLPAASEVGMRGPMQNLQKQNLALKRVIKEIWWMAQRYADPKFATKQAPSFRAGSMSARYQKWCSN